VSAPIGDEESILGKHRKFRALLTLLDPGQAEALDAKMRGARILCAGGIAFTLAALAISIVAALMNYPGPPFLLYPTVFLMIFFVGTGLTIAGVQRTDTLRTKARNLAKQKRPDFFTSHGVMSELGKDFLRQGEGFYVPRSASTPLPHSPPPPPPGA
jgi:hypothetical protein